VVGPDCEQFGLLLGGARGDDADGPWALAISMAAIPTVLLAALMTIKSPLVSLLWWISAPRAVMHCI